MRGPRISRKKGRKYCACVARGGARAGERRDLSFVRKRRERGARAARSAARARALGDLKPHHRRETLGEPLRRSRTALSVARTCESAKAGGGGFSASSATAPRPPRRRRARAPRHVARAIPRLRVVAHAELGARDVVRRQREAGAQLARHAPPQRRAQRLRPVVQIAGRIHKRARRAEAAEAPARREGGEASASSPTRARPLAPAARRGRAEGSAHMLSPLARCAVCRPSAWAASHAPQRREWEGYWGEGERRGRRR